MGDPPKLFCSGSGDLYIGYSEIPILKNLYIGLLSHYSTVPADISHYRVEEINISPTIEQFLFCFNNVTFYYHSHIWGIIMHRSPYMRGERQRPHHPRHRNIAATGTKEREYITPCHILHSSYMLNVLFNSIRKQMK